MRASALGILAACAVATACSPAPAPAPAPPAADEALDAGALFDLAMIRDYKCADGAMISVRFGHDPHDARVSADGGLPSILKPVLAASGARYEAAGMSLHTKGNEALWTDFGKAMTRCVEVVQ